MTNLKMKRKLRRDMKYIYKISKNFSIEKTWYENYRVFFHILVSYVAKKELIRDLWTEHLQFLLAGHKILYIELRSVFALPYQRIETR